MLRINAKTNMGFMSPLQTVCKFLAILRPVKFSNEEDHKCKHLYAILVTSLFLASYMLTTYGKIVHLWSSMAPTAFLLDVFSDLSLIITNVAAIVFVNLRKGPAVRRFLENIMKIDQKFRQVMPVGKYPNRRFVTEMILVHLYLVLIFAFNAYTWLSALDSVVYRLIILREIQNYFIVMLAMLLRNYAYAINYRFEVVNELLSTCQWIFIDELACFAKRAPDCTKHWTLRKITKVYAGLADIVDQYNGIFGWQFVTLFINIEINLLLAINVALVYGDGKLDLNGVTFGWDVISVCVIWGSLPILIAICIFSACNHATDEMQQTSVIAYNLLQEVGTEATDLVYKQELSELAQMASNRCPHFTAAGLFTINYSVLFGLISSIASYLIVLIQFK